MFSNSFEVIGLKDEEHFDLLKKHLINIAYSEVFVSIFKLIAMSTAIVLIFYPLNDTATILSWYFFALLVYGFKIGDAFYYKVNKHKHSYKEWFWRFFLLTAAVVVVWNLFVFHFFPKQLDYQIILVFFIVMITGCGATALASYKKFLIPFQIGMLYPMAFMLYQQGGYSYILIIIYMAYVSITGSKIHNTILEAYKHQLRAEENIKIVEAQREELSSVNTKLEEKVSERTKELEAKTNQIALLLDNSGEAFFSYDKDMMIDLVYSKAFIDFVGFIPDGYRIDELLVMDPKLKKRFIMCSQDALEDDEDSSRVELYLSLLPNEFEHDGRCFSARYLLVDHKIMGVLNDITEEKQLALKHHQDSLNIQMIVSAVTRSGEFFSNIQDFKNFVEEGSLAWKSGHVHQLYRLIHTYKGSFSQLGFYRLPKMLHIVETQLQEMLEGDGLIDNTIIDQIFMAPFLKVLNHDMRLLTELFGESFILQQGFIILTPDFAELIENLVEEKLLCSDQDDKTRERLYQLLHLRSISLFSVLENFNPLVERISHNLEKLILPIQLHGEDILVPIDKYKYFIRSLGHLIRNAIDHGIELPEERLEIGKDEYGVIQCEIQKEGDVFIVSICDDGRGIDERQLREQASKKIGINTTFMTLDELIFCDGLSSKDNTSDYSGRGIGMSAVYEAVIALHGRVELETSMNIGTCIRIILPLPK